MSLVLLELKMSFTRRMGENIRILEKYMGENIRMGENICKWSNWQRTSLQSIQTAHAIQHQNDKQPNQKLGRRPK